MAEKVLSNVAQVTSKENSTEINMLSSAIGNEIDRNSRVTNATLVLRVKGGANGSGFDVKAQSNGGNFEIIDFISPAANGDLVHLNITEEVNCIIKDSNEKVVIPNS